MKTTKALSDEQIHQWAQKFDLPDTEIYKIDTANFFEFISYLDSSVRKDWLQPLQIKAFDKNGSPYAHLINCHVGSDKMPKITWNRFGSFDSYPMSKGHVKIDTSLMLDIEMSMIQHLNSQEHLNAKNYLADEVLIVYWSRWMNKRTKELVNYIEDYRALNKERNIQVLYVNNDNLYVDL